jgi:type VI protein secretion system component VasK
LDYIIPLSILSDFMTIISGYFAEIWGFLIYVGGVSAFIVVLVGAILSFVQVKVGKITGPRLILSGILLAIIIVYFTIYPPDFVIS